MKRVIHRFKQLFLLTFLVVLYSTSFLFAQGWERTFGGNTEDQAFGITQTVDGGFAIVGFSESQGRFGTNVTLIKIDDAGNEEWSQSLGMEGDDIGYDVVQEKDGTYLIVGQTNGSGNGNKDILLIKADASGKMIWQQTYGGEGDDQGWSMVIAKSGDYYITGSRVYDGNADLYLLKVNQDGEILWDKRFGGEKTDEGFSVIETSKEEVVVVGVTRSFANPNAESSSDIYFIKTDKTGETILESKYGNLQRDVAKSVVETADGGFALTGIVGKDGDIILMRLDEQGNELWSRTYGGSISAETGEELVLTNDGGFVIAGTNELTERTIQISLLRTDSKGEQIWNRLYGGVGQNFGNSVVATRDGGFVVVGNFDINTDPNSLVPLNDIYVAKASSEGNVFSNIIKGQVHRDINANCELDKEEKLLEDWLVQFRNGTDILYATTDENGTYEVALSDGNYNVGLVVLNNAWDVCQNYNVNFNAADTIELNFAARATVENCPVIVADISAPFLEPCRSTDYTVSLCNRGIVLAEDAFIDIQFDRDQTVNFSSLPWTDHTGNIYRFFVGDLRVEECNDFKVNVSVDCNAVVGKSHCVEAYASPNALCIPPPPTWNGASIRVDGECKGDSVQFVITNIGDGDMTSSSDFIIIVDAVDLRQGASFQLPSQGSDTLNFPADGSTIRIIAEQPMGHPYGENASAAVEGCPFGRPFSTGFMTMFSDGDDLPFYAADCQENKVVTGIVEMTPSPKGYGTSRYISSTDEIEYHILFQNTGSDSINRVIIRDTLSSVFDIASITPGASSHPYDFEVTGEGYIKFTLENIGLPNKAMDEANSFGFVKFRVSQKNDTPIGEVIENKVSVVYDFGAPIVSNTTRHTIGGETVEEYVEISTDVEEVQIPGVEVKVYPNPFVESATVELIGLGDTPNIDFQLYDVTGKLVQTDSHRIPKFRFHPNQLPGGLYFFSILTDGQLVTTGKVFIK